MAFPLRVISQRDRFEAELSVFAEQIKQMDVKKVDYLKYMDMKQKEYDAFKKKYVIEGINY